MASCSSVSVVPEDLEEQVHEGISFAKLREAPLQYKGKTVVFGGQVLSSRRLDHSTQIEVLQLPLDRSMEPGGSLQKSQGRFIAIEEEFLDPATLPFNTRVTVVGEVTGVVTRPLDETTYDYPTLVIKKLTVWSAISTDQVYRSYPYPYISPYWGPYWRPYRGPWWWY